MGVIMEQNINAKFDEKIKELEEKNCAELTLTSVLDVLGINNGIINNLMIPLAGGFGGYKSEKGWQGGCGAVCGGCAAAGVILGGKERMSNELIPIAYLKGAKFATDFEKEFGTVVCSELCGYDFSDPNAFLEYEKNNIWEKTCSKYVIWAVDHVRKLMRKDLRKKW
ncbi:hypothetical protein ES708_02426 [subsurface metagenome]